MKATCAIVIALTGVCPMAVTGQSSGGGQASGSLARAAGGKSSEWTTLEDRDAKRSPRLPGDPSLVVLDSGVKVRSGPGALFYREGDIGKGEYAVSARFTQIGANSGGMLGLIIGGRDLAGPAQEYLYFAIKSSSGEVTVESKRVGSQVRTPLVPPSTSSAVRRGNGDGSAVINEMIVVVNHDVILFLINGRPVQQIPRALLGDAPSDGLVGLRLEGGQDAIVSAYRLIVR